jgi:hypothetical protein
MGKEERVRYLSPEREECFRLLSRPNYQVTSDETTRYNCIAYAAGDDSIWWEPGKFDDFPTYWPKGAVKDYSLKALVSVFRTLGYRVCKDGELEPGYEKVALYIKENGQYGHAARQQADGSWVSKLGDWEDIRHTTAEAVETTEEPVGRPKYGKVAKYMKRKRKAIQE